MPVSMIYSLHAYQYHEWEELRVYWSQLSILNRVRGNAGIQVCRKRKLYYEATIIGENTLKICSHYKIAGDTEVAFFLQC